VELSLRLLAHIQAASSFPGAVAGEGEALYWPGCVELRADLSAGRGWSARPFELLAACSVRAASAGPRCCGWPLLRAGQTEPFSALARANAELIAASGVREVITACPHCAETMRTAYERVGAEVQVPVIDLGQLAASKLGSGGAEQVCAVVAGECTGASATTLASVVAGEPLPWMRCGDEPRGPELRSRLRDLLVDADRRGAEAIVMPCPHGAALLQAAAAPGAWRLGRDLPILDLPSWLGRLAAARMGERNEAAKGNCHGG
jgi:hypothetical protein